MERFAHIDIPEAGNHPLIQQRAFQRRLATAKLLRQGRDVESCRQRLRAKAPQCGVRVHLVRRQQRHESKAPGIVEDDDRPGRKLEDDVIVRVVTILAWHRFIPVSMPDTKRTGHTEVHQEHVAGPKLSQKVFRAAPDTSHGLPFETMDEIRRERVAQVRAPQNDVPNAGARHRALQAPALVLNFRKLWHSL